MTKGKKAGDCQFSSVKNLIFSLLSYAYICFCFFLCTHLNVYFAGNITLWNPNKWAKITVWTDVMMAPNRGEWCWCNQWTAQSCYFFTVIGCGGTLAHFFYNYSLDTQQMSLFVCLFIYKIYPTGLCKFSGSERSDPTIWKS